MQKENHFPAFPVTAGNQVYATGMTLRDWFAGQSLPSVVLDCAETRPPSGENWYHMVARTSYEIADAMLEARK